MNNILTVFSLLKLNINEFNPNGGVIFNLLNDIGSYMKKFNIDSHKMKQNIESVLQFNFEKIEVEIDFINYIITSISQINRSGEDIFIKFIIYIIEIYIDNFSQTI